MTAIANVLRDQLPLRYSSLDAAARPTGLVIVDIVNGFATTGAGALAPIAPDAQVEGMIGETDRLARAFVAAGRPVLAFLDTHVPGKPEPPYPPHCEQGSGEEELVPALKWLEGRATLVRKDCINGFIGAFDPATGRNAVVEWVDANRLEAVVVVGICTDICVMDFVLTMLSARNHSMMSTLAEVAVFEPACATYDHPGVHPKALTHHAGLYFMASRGAILLSEVLA